MKEKEMMGIMKTKGALGTYILDKNNNVIPASFEEYVIFMSPESQINKKQVNRDYVQDKVISTVFLGINHGFYGPPLFFETMIFDEDGKDIYCERYTTWQEAASGHKVAIDWVKNGYEDA